jgi:hypothetical protein
VLDMPVTAATEGFGYAEHLLIWSWRRIAAGQGACPIIARVFVDGCGEDAPEVLATFCAFLRALAYASRRPLRIGHPGCMALTGDELQVLNLIAAAQADHRAFVTAHLRWLAQADLRGILEITAHALATAFLANELRLALPASIGPMACSRDAATGLGSQDIESSGAGSFQV